MRDALKALQNGYIDHFTKLWNGSLPKAARMPSDQFIMHHIILTLSGLASRRIFLHDDIAEKQHIELLIELAVGLDGQRASGRPETAGI